MTNKYNLVESEKHGFCAAISVIVTSEETSFLRFVGSYPEFALMTATASENDRSYIVCNDRDRLNACLDQIAIEMGMPTSLKIDTAGREYISIEKLNFSGSDNKQINQYLDAVIKRFFEIYSESYKSEISKSYELEELYDLIAINDSGEDVYLGDGVWLGRNGSLADRGR